MTEDTAVATRPEEPVLTPYEVIEKVITSGDLSNMKPEERVAFYWRTCESLGLNPLTRPFQYLNLNGKMTLYASKDATEQLRRVNRVSVTKLDRDRDEGLGIHIVTAYGRTPDGREDAATGIVNIKGLSGEALANAMMKAETKAKRRLTLALVGLGFLDESEVEGLGERVDIDEAGEIAPKSKPSLLEAVQQQAEALTRQAEESEAESTPEPVAEAILAQPMTIEESASTVDDLVDVIADEAGLNEPTGEPLHKPVDEPIDPDSDDGTVFDPEPPEESPAPVSPLRTEEPENGMTVNQLAEAARVGNIGKRAFASALDCVPADVGAKIEAMTDVERYRLAQSLGIAR